MALDKRLQNSSLNFSNPNSPTAVSPTWPKYEVETGEYLLLNKTMTDKSRLKYFYAEEANFWLHVFPDLAAVIPEDDKGHCEDGTFTSAASNLQLFNLAVLCALSVFLCIV